MTAGTSGGPARVSDKTYHILAGSKRIDENLRREHHCRLPSKY